MINNHLNSKSENAETIFALATGALPAAIAIIRLSGPASSAIIKALTQKEKLPLPRQASRRLLYQTTKNAQQKYEVIDEAVILWFPAPNSFTGEDMAELQVHGSRAVVEIIYQELLRFPTTRPAEPGEFARRAFNSGKLDLTAIEGLADLIAAETQAQQQQAMRQYQGELAQLYDGWRQQLIKLSAYLEAYIDFPDEELPLTLSEQIHQNLQALEQELHNHLADEGRGQKLRQGFTLAIIGPPNAGKSSLMNWLTRRETSIVSAIPGTTRDVIETTLNIAGIPVVLLDTAGIRPATDAIEQEGVRRAYERAQQSDLTIIMLDINNGTQIPPDIMPFIKEDMIILFNKFDLLNNQQIHKKNIYDSNKIVTHPNNMFFVILNDSRNLPENLLDPRHAFFPHLEQQVKKLAGSRPGPALTRHRHRLALERCLSNIQQARHNKVLELKAEDLRLASRALGEITGRVHIEEMLDVIFKEFCIGK